MVRPYRSVAECLSIIGWNNSVFATRLNVSPRWALRIKNDERSACPIVVLIWLNKLADLHEENSLPSTWERRT